MCEFCRGLREIVTGLGTYKMVSIIPLPGINLTTGLMLDAQKPYHVIRFEYDGEEGGEELEADFCPLCGEYLKPDFEKQNEYIQKLNKLKGE